MSFSTEVEVHLQAEAHISLKSPLKPPATDTVDWASSQPVVIQSLLKDATERQDKRSPRPDATCKQRRDQKLPIPCSTRPTGRPLRRDNSSLRARLGLNPPNLTSNPPPAPVDPFWSKDRHAILAACQDVSERMDENVFSPLDRVDVVSMRQRAKALYSKGPPKQRQTSMPLPDYIHMQERQQPGRARTSELRAGSSLPSLSSSSSAPPSIIKSSYSFSSDTSATTEPNSGDITMAEIEDKPIISPDSAWGGGSSVMARSSSFSRSKSAPDHSTAPAEKLHPLLQDHKSSQNPTKPPVMPIRNSERLPPPASSNSTSRPVLGMRRPRNASSAVLHSLPSRRKGFKPPLLSQPASQPAPSAHLVQKHKNTSSSDTPLSRHGSHLSVSAALETTEFQKKNKVEHCGAYPQHHFPSSSPQSDDEPPCSACPSMDESPDADSSFGELSSFDMDALEATMQQYD